MMKKKQYYGWNFLTPKNLALGLKSNLDLFEEQYFFLCPWLLHVFGIVPHDDLIELFKIFAEKNGANVKNHVWFGNGNSTHDREEYKKLKQLRVKTILDTIKFLEDNGN